MTTDDPETRYLFECRECGPGVRIPRDHLGTYARQPCPRCGAAPVWRLVRCVHCSAEIEADASRTGHLGAWRRVDGEPCSNPGGHLPERLPVLPPPGH